MSYQLTDILNRCDKDDADFLISTIDSYINFSDDKGLRDMRAAWGGNGKIPLALNKKLEREIRYLGSNDLAYMTRKLRGYDPAGVSVDEIIDDLCKLLKVNVSNASTLEARLEIFAGHVVNKEFANLSPKRQREILESMDFDQHHRQEIFRRILENKELLLTVILPILGKQLGPQVLQGLIAAIMAPFIGREAAKMLLSQIVKRIPMVGPWLGPLMLAGTSLWTIVDIMGPASRKTIPLILYMGVLCLRDGETRDFAKSMGIA